MVEPDENYVKSMLNMGFADAGLIRRALVVAKNDLNVAVGLLTDETASFELEDDEGASGEPPPPYDEVVSGSDPAKGEGPLEFPTTNLYELEDRVFVESWSIPYKREESLGKCLISAERFAAEGLLEADENCRRFVERALPECFKKLLTSEAVMRWNPEIHDGIYDMVCLLIDLVATRLKYEPVPYGLLQVLTQAFDPETKFQTKNKTKGWDKAYYEGVFGDDQCYAQPPQNANYYSTEKGPCGWLVNIINQFAEKGGFEEIRKLIENTEKVTAPVTALLKPIGVCAGYLNAQVISEVFSQVLEKTLAYIQELADDDMKQKEVGKVFDLLTTLKLLCLTLWQEVTGVDDLRLEVALKMLKAPHFNAKMNSLKEVCKLIDDSEKCKNVKISISQEAIAKWLVDNRVLSVAFESNLHQTQYCDRLKVVVEFLGNRLTLDELTTIWKMQLGKHPIEVDNIHNILATAAVRFNTNQLDHLFTLIQQSWGTENDRMKDKLLVLIGRIGKEARVAKITTKVLDLLWSLAHLPSLTTDMVDQALKSHIDILSDSFTVKDQIKKSYAVKCIEDIKKGGVLPELNKTYDIIKLTTSSIVNCHQQAIAAVGLPGLGEDTLLDGRYTLKDCIHIHLKFLAFVLQEAVIYLPWHRARDIWDALVSSPDACEFDRETCFEWFTKQLCDMEAETQSQILTTKILKMDPSKLSMKGFQCFRAFFESVNHNEHKHKKTANTYTVEKMDLIGLDYLWRIALEVPSEEIAAPAVKLLIQLSYTWLSPKLKKDPVTIHKKFIMECYKRLEVLMSVLCASPMSQVASSVTTTATAPISPVTIAPTPLRANHLLNIERLLMIVEHYIITVEDLVAGPRTLLPHAASFHGYPINVNVNCDVTKQNLSLQCHSNENLRSVRHRIAAKLNVSAEQIQIFNNEKLLMSSKDQKLLYQLDFQEDQQVFVKTSNTSVTMVPTREEASASGCNRQSIALEQERMIPGVLMATECKAFDKLYQLAELEEPSITAHVQKLVMLLPTDPQVQEALDCIGQQFTLSCSPGGSSLDESSSLSPIDINLKSMFRCTSVGMSPFRVLYNLEVLSSKLMPTAHRDGGAAARAFKESFLAAGGLNIVVNILQKDMFPSDVDTEIRRGCYGICLQLARFLLCGQTSENSFTIPPTRESVTMAASPVSMATMDLDSSDCGNSSGVEAKRPRSSSMIDDVHPTVRVAIETMNRDDFAETIACLMRVAWAAAGGKLHLAGGRQHLSSQSSDDDGGSDSDSLKSFRSSIASNNNLEVSNKDVVIVAEALQLLVLCLQLRTQLIGVFYYLPNVNEFIVEILIGSPHPQVRLNGVEQFLILSQTPVSDTKVQTPNHFLLTVLLNAPLPLWTPNRFVRGKNHRLQKNCTQFFDLLCRLMDYLTVTEQRLMKVNPTKMLENEIQWLLNFESSSNLDNGPPLLAGHLRFLRTLLTCEGVDKRKWGQAIIRDLLGDFLFPASKLIFETRGTPNKSAIVDVYPKCVGPDCQVAAYDVLVELAEGCCGNLFDVVSELISMHHTGEPANFKEWEFQPPVAPRAMCKFVGLKNAGATCYMNSVLQQLYMQPGIREVRKPHPCVFYQIQSLFGCLMDSKLQYFAPEQFWKCFKLWGQPVNVREQQDAFEFFCNLTDQLDEHLKSKKQDQLFKKTFCGMFADQKICKECNHRYEREEAFYSLPVTVKNHNLQDSLEQFVNGEILEGDNAYFCEKCNKRRTTVKRMCIKTLPPVLVIQLKRFGYDWEAGRALKFDDYFEFPWTLDMEPYTSDGVARREQANASPDTDSDNGSVTSSSQSLNSIHSNSSVTVTPSEITYDLVGAIVHSGQANAGHYYSYIKDRRSGAEGAETYGKWFKFNDTIVEEFEMTEESVEAECFGGTYKATVYDTVNSYPETRHRYWSAYMLFYEASDANKMLSVHPSRGPLVRQEAVIEGRSNPPSPSSSSVSSSSGPPSPTRTDGLSQLTALVQKGERKGIFRDKMPASIQRMVHAENLQFMQNRDVYNTDYFKFILNLATCNRSFVSNKQVLFAVCSLQLSIQFLFNTYFRTTKKLRMQTQEWCEAVEFLLRGNSEACTWFVQFLSGERGKGYIRPFLLEAPSAEVRKTFSRILVFTFESYIHHGGSIESGPFYSLIDSLLAMCNRDVIDHHKTCAEYFWALNRYANIRRKTCEHLIARETFQLFLSFLVGPSTEYGSNRRWSSLQSQEFTALYTAIATLVCCSDVSSQMTVEPTRPRPLFLDIMRNLPLIPMPLEMDYAIFGANADRYIKEATLAVCEVADTSEQISNMFIHCSWCNENFSTKVLQHLKIQLAAVAANDMKNVFSTLLSLLLLEDPLQLQRIKSAVDDGDGILALVKSNNASDSRRAYQCIKFLVQLAHRCPTAKDYLLQNSTRWQWAVQWLKKKMSEHYWPPQSYSSNEHSTSRTFQRTSSAADTLAEATALLTELD
ncbi:predicted protein, partial [Nematostella vectensis]